MRDGGGTQHAAAGAPADGRAPAGVASPTLRRHVAEQLLLAVILYAAARLGLAFATVHGNASPVWPPTGLALGALLLFGNRLCLAVFAASFTVVLQSDAPPLAAVLIGLGNACEALLGAFLLRRVAGFSRSMERLRDVGWLALFGAGVAPLVSTTAGVIALCGTGSAPWSAAPGIALTWWTGNALGALLITPVVLAWARPSPASPATRLEVALAAAGLATTCGLTFFRPESLAVADAAFAFGTFPFLAWIALRASRRVSATTALAVATAAVAGTAMGRGPFHADDPVVAALLVQVFQAVATLAALLLSAVVAQQRNAERAWRDSDALLAQFAAQADQVFWLMQADPPATLMVSPAFETIWGRSTQALLDDPHLWVSCVHPEDRARVGETYARWLQTPHQGGWRAEYRVVRPDGEVRWVSDAGVKLPASADRPLRAAGIARDVTNEALARVERERVERQLQDGQRLESLGLLAGGVAHDFNNILAVVLGAAQLVKADLPAGSPAREHVERIEKSSRHAAGICRQLLASAGQGTVQVRPVDVNAVIDEAMPLLHAALPPGAALELRLERGLPAVVADAAQLRQVVMNLVINAGEALREGRGRIVVRTHLGDPGEECLAIAQPQGLAPGRYVQIEVEDDGVGMDEEVRQRIFDPFYSTKFVGRGLGLSAVLGVARAHGGAVCVRSDPGRGSSLVVLLPPAEGASPEAPAPPLDSTWPRALRVLVVDDDADVRAVLRGLLESMRARVTLADGPAVALALFERDPRAFDVVLLDLSMPGMTGDEVLRKMHAIRPDARVVLMSGYTETEVRERLPDLRAAGFLQKPFGIDDVRERLAELLRG